MKKITRCKTRWLKHRIEEMKLEKVKDTAQEEIDRGNHIEYPLLRLLEMKKQKQ